MAILRRELNLYDLTLLLVIAVANINTIPLIAAEGWQAITYWLLAAVLFLIPQALSVAEFGQRFPGEGGIYLWTREMFGDFHAFISGWCYWTNNLFYFPSVLFILIGVAVYTGGAGAAKFGASSSIVGLGALTALWLITLLHIRGLSVGKWINNIGAIGTWFGLLVLIAVGAIVINRKGHAATPFEWKAFIPSLKNMSGWSAFSVMLYSLVGLELGSVMGDEIKNPQKIVRTAALLGGAISILLYLIGTASLLMAVPAGQIGAVQGLMQAVTLVAGDLQLFVLVPAVAGLLSLAVLGVGSAWIAGAARIPFVMGLDVYLPKALGKTHPTWKTPYVALLVQALLSSVFILISLIGSFVSDAYKFLLLSSVVLQLIPFLYLFIGMWKLGKKKVMALLGTIATAFGILFAFIPPADTPSKTIFLLKVFGASFLMLIIAVIFYSVGERRKRLVVSAIK